MSPEQIPGTVFVLLTAAVALFTHQYIAVLALALGCAAGWLTYTDAQVLKTPAFFGALFLWALGFVLTLNGVL